MKYAFFFLMVVGTLATAPCFASEVEVPLFGPKSPRKSRASQSAPMIGTPTDAVTPREVPVSEVVPEDKKESTGAVNFPLFIPPDASNQEALKNMPFQGKTEAQPTLDLPPPPAPPLKDVPTVFDTPVIKPEKEEVKKTEPVITVKPVETVKKPAEEKVAAPASATSTSTPTPTILPEKVTSPTVKTPIFSLPGKTTAPTAVKTPAVEEAKKPAVVKEPAADAQKSSIFQKKLDVVTEEDSSVLSPTLLESLPTAPVMLPTELLAPKPPSEAIKLDIMGLMIHMTPSEIIVEAGYRGFQIYSVANEIPALMERRSERACRAEKIFKFDDIRACVRQMAETEGIYYVSQVVMVNPDTKEQVVAWFTSNYTGNKAYKIEYTSLGDNSWGTSLKDTASKIDRQMTFWELVAEKYGAATYENQKVWGDPRTIYLKAYMEGNAMNAKLVLEDKELPAVDAGEARTNAPKSLDAHSFSFMK